MAAALVVTLAAAVPSSAALTPSVRVDLYGTALFDTGWPVSEAWTRQGTATTRVTTDDAVVAQVTGATVTLAPPTGRILETGRTPLGLRGPVTASLTGAFCPGNGVLDVTRVRYEGEEVAELQASFSLSCVAGKQNSRNRVDGVVEGTIQIGTTSARPRVTPSITDLGTKARDSGTRTRLTLENTGDTDTGALGSATTRRSTADFVVSVDGCAGRVLQAGESCELEVEHRSAEAGYDSDLILVPTPGYPGGTVVAPVVAWTVDLPDSVSLVQAWPTATGAALSWRYSLGSRTFRVERLDGDHWVDAGGTAQTWTGSDPYGRWRWADDSISVGEERTYRVVATNEAGASAPSEAATFTRPAAPTSGGSSTTTRYAPDTDTAEPPFSSVGAVTRMNLDDLPFQPLRTSLVGEIWATAPLLTGPGRYPMTYPMNGSACASAYLDVVEVAYLPTPTLAASWWADCSTGVHSGQIRINNATPLPALTISQADLTAPYVRVGEQSPTRTVTVRSTGDAAAPVGDPVLRGPRRDEWSVSDDRCPASLDPGESCEMDLVATPTLAGATSARLTLQVPSGWVSSPRILAVGVTPPPAPLITSLVRTLGTVALTVDTPDGTGGAPATVQVHRWVGQEHRAFDVARNHVPGSPTVMWSDADAPAGARYAVQAVNDFGTGPLGVRTSPTTSTDGALTIASATLDGSALPFRLAATGLDGGPFAAPVLSGITDVGTADVSPDGRRLLFSTCQVACRLFEAPLDGSAAPRLIATVDTVRRIEWSPDGSRALLVGWGSSGDATVSIVTLASGKTVTVKTPGQSLHTSTRAVWWPDGTSFVVNDVSSLVRREATAAGTVIQDLKVRGWDQSITPDGRWLTFVTAAGDEVTGARMSTTGGPVVIDATVPSRHVEWGPDGRSWLSTQVQYLGDRVLSRGVLGVRDATRVAFTPAADRWERSADYVGWTGGRVTIARNLRVSGRTVTVPFSTAALPAGTTTTCTVDDAPAKACPGTAFRAVLRPGVHIVRVHSSEPGGRTTVAARMITVPTSKSAYR